MAGPGEAVRPLAAGLDQGVADPAADQHRGDRQVAGREALGGGDDVGREAEPLAAPPAAGPAEAADHLVGDQQHVVLAADALDLLPVALRRHDHAARTLDRLADERGDVVGPELEDALFQAARGLLAMGLRREVAAMRIPVGRLDVLEAWQRQVGLGMHRRQPGQARGRERHAVVAVRPADHDLLGRPALQVPEPAHELDRGVVGLGAGVGEEHAIEAWRQLGEAGGELDRGRRRALKEGVVVGQRRHLAARRLDQLGAAVADIDAPQAGHAVEQPVALAVPEPAALGAGDDPAAPRRQLGMVGERVKVVPGIELAPAKGVCRGHDLFFPNPPAPQPKMARGSQVAMPGKRASTTSMKSWIATNGTMPR